MEAFRRSNPSMCGNQSNLRRVSVLHSLLGFSQCSFHGPLTTVEIQKFNADDLLSAVFGMRYKKISNPSQGKNPGSNPGIATISLAPFR